ncbi:hypothetical protein CMV_026268 [Castanea mollissima]|uniref:Uncharacterized protein n=1 Tax=Castanea mollissima TaxID=60419 RepID=A0A8J4V418_9ROSI|nr:hypothetical protein CMV_026268 [Castanea mollissima]
MAESASGEIQLVTSSINNEDHNSQTEGDISSGNENTNDESVMEIRNMDESRKIDLSESEQCRIYKVPDHVRKCNAEAYTPQVISIGPIHYGNEELKAMEGHKVTHFKNFLKQSRSDLMYLEKTIRELEGSIRGCYAHTIDLCSDEFVQMILVDACFILELFFAFSSRRWTSADFTIVRQRDKAVTLDILLLENQLPFFVIETLYHLAIPSTSSSMALPELSLRFFGHLENWSIWMPVPTDVKIQHFTDLLRTFYVPPPWDRPYRCHQRNDLLYTATQLHKAGVKFKLGTSDYCFDINFSKGVLKMPSLKLYEWTEIIARNIMALEQTLYMEEPIFTDYFTLMDLLIKTREDVNLLCDKKILVHRLSDNNAAESMIKNLNKGITHSNLGAFNYSDLCNDLNSFYEHPWHRWKAILRTKFFVTTAFFILVLTIIQTMCSVIQLAYLK